MPLVTPDKNFLQSKTLWGIILSAVPLVSQVTGVEITQEETTTLVGLAEEIVGAFGLGREADDFPGLPVAALDHAGLARVAYRQDGAG